MTTSPREHLAATTDPWEAAIDAAYNLDRYGPGWDGEGADPVPDHLIRDTVEFLRFSRRLGLPIPACVYPLSDGTVFLEFHGSSGAGMSINLRPGKRVEVLTYNPGQEPAFDAFVLGDGEAGDPTAYQAGGQARDFDPFYTFDLAA